jgi:hypothetical protein
VRPLFLIAKLVNITRLFNLVGGFNPSKKNESQWEGLSHILWKIKKYRNHHPNN